MRLPRWTPCFADPDNFDCRDCEIGFLAHCPLRTDETLRSYHSAIFQQRHAAGLSSGQLVDIGTAAASAVGATDALSAPASLVRERLGAAAAELTTDQIAQALRTLPGVRETSPGMFSIGSWTPEPGTRAEELVHSGTAIAQALVAYPAPARPEQLRIHRRLMGAALAMTYADRQSGLVGLEAQIDALSTQVLRAEGWSISDLVACATGTKEVAVNRRGEFPERTSLLSAVVAHDLLQRMDIPQVHAEHTQLMSTALLQNQRLVASVAVGYSQGASVRFADLFQIGTIGLRRAIERFDAFRGYAFSTFASPWIRQAITRALADQERTIRLPVHMLEQVARVRRAFSTLESELGRPPEDEELAERVAENEARRSLSRELGRLPSAVELGQRLRAETRAITPEQAAAILTYARAPLSLEVVERQGSADPAAEPENPLEAEPATWMINQIADSRSEGPPEEAEGQDLRRDVAEVLDSLTPRERRVLELRFGVEDQRARTLEEVGRDFNVTRERIRQIEAKALRKIKHPSRIRKLTDYRRPARAHQPLSDELLDTAAWPPEDSSDLVQARRSGRDRVVEVALASLGLSDAQRQTLDWLLTPYRPSVEPRDPGADGLSWLACLVAAATGRHTTELTAIATLQPPVRDYHSTLSAIAFDAVESVVRSGSVDFVSLTDAFRAPHEGHACPVAHALVRLSGRDGMLRRVHAGVTAGLGDIRRIGGVGTLEGRFVALVISGLRSLA